MSLIHSTDSHLFPGLEWTFEKDNAGFVPNQKVKISREVIDREHFLVCQSSQIASTPGIRLTDIVLPVTSNEYCMEVEGFANNKKSFLWIKGEKGNRLIQPYAYLPELTKKNKITVAPFKLWAPKAGGNQNITIGILIGGDEQPNTNDMFFIKKIRIYERSLSQNHTSLEVPQITRIYSSRTEIDAEQVPKRDNGTAMNTGEYAIIKCVNNETDNGCLFVAHSDPSKETNGKIRLRYLCNALESNQSVLTQCVLTQVIQLLNEDKVIPIYDSSDALKANADSHSPDTFYSPYASTGRIDEIAKGDRILLYLDNEGYVRWTRDSQLIRPKIELDNIEYNNISET